uniref:Protein Flattop n=1 Tax=Cyclopterus lumpus TaxID=8103 RepID=A0A8C3AU16_CYCLU
MSKSSANQYDSAFQPQRLQNWCEPRHFKEGHTTFIANNRGHLGKAWPDFKGTWDLPARIPARCINPTGRSVEGLNRLKTWGFAPEHGSKHTDRLHGVGQHTICVHFLFIVLLPHVCISSLENNKGFSSCLYPPFRPMGMSKTQR